MSVPPVPEHETADRAGMDAESAHGNDWDRLIRLISAGHACIRIVTTEEQHAMDVIMAVALTRRLPMHAWSATRGLGRATGAYAMVETSQETEHPAAALYQLAHLETEPCIAVAMDLASHLQDARTLRALREAIATFREQGGCLILLDHADTFPEVIRQCATPFEMSFASDDEIEKIIRDTLREIHAHTAAVKATLSRKDLRIIVGHLRGLTRTQVAQVIAECVVDDQQFDAADLPIVLARKRQHLEADGVLEHVEAPIDIREVGGLATLKRWLADRERSFDDEAGRFGLHPPRGVLLLGVQGAGKSMSAKAIATAWKRPLLRLDPGRLYDRYVGESERKLRSALKQAELMAPCVLWIDEIEKGFASAAAHSTDGGLSQRMFGTLLTWMQEHTEPVFLVATANNIDALPPELLRKGRFDEIFFVDLPDEDVRRLIFEIHLRKRARDPGEFNLDALAAASLGFSGAEIEQAIIAALHTAYGRDGDLTTKLILEQVAASPPLSQTMAERISRLRSWARGRCVPAG